jgi:hypothetical protein
MRSIFDPPQQNITVILAPTISMLPEVMALCDQYRQEGRGPGPGRVEIEHTETCAIILNPELPLEQHDCQPISIKCYGIAPITPASGAYPHIERE